MTPGMLTKNNRGPLSRQGDFAGLTRSRRPVIATFAPSLAKTFAIASPIPVPPPVTIAILCSSLMDVSPQLLSDCELPTAHCFRRMIANHAFGPPFENLPADS